MARVAHPLFDALKDASIKQQRLASKVVRDGVQTSTELKEQLAGMGKSAIAYCYEARLAIIFSGAYIGFRLDEYVQPYADSGQLRRFLPIKKCGELWGWPLLFVGTAAADVLEGGRRFGYQPNSFCVIGKPIFSTSRIHKWRQPPFLSTVSSAYIVIFAPIQRNGSGGM